MGQAIAALVTALAADHTMPATHDARRQRNGNEWSFVAAGYRILSFLDMIVPEDERNHPQISQIVRVRPMGRNQYEFNRGLRRYPRISWSSGFSLRSCWINSSTAPVAIACVFAGFKSPRMSNGAG